MPVLLQIDSSADLATSRTRAITDALAASWAARGDDYRVVHRDLHLTPPPHLAGTALHWRREDRLPEERWTPEQERVQDELIRELLGADAIVIGAPLYNFSMPSTLKAWIDHIHVGGVTAGDERGPGPLAGRHAVIATSSGIAYDPGSPTEGWAHAVPPLQIILGELLGMNVEVIATSYALADRRAPLAEFRERAAAELAGALGRAAELGGALPLP